MIVEDYVSFEIAKLLKEKGFPQEYDIYHSMVYNEEDYENEYEVQRMVVETEIIKAGTLSSYPLGVPEPKCYCPTLQMAMKWLREKYNIHMYVEHYGTLGWIFILHRLNMGSKIRSNEFHNTYEEACEAAIKYCLKNLI